ncbi:MAG TPA: GNA1162 family protein [Prolixibacteraceae bacterium]|nr:GNA1162 family protein [Prolixibacteraceae bacterium]
MKKIIYFAALAILFASCSTSKLQTKSVAYKTLYEEKPLSILALPPINKSTKVEAKELFYSSLAVPFTLNGYYVMPPLLSMEILKEESAYDAEMFINGSMKKVGELFGVDAVLFTTIHEWTKTSIASQINVKIEYMLKSTKTDEILFDRIGDVTLSVSVNTGSIIGNVVGSMIATSLTKEIVVGRNCNIYTISDIPAGKYSPLFGLDGDKKAQPKEFKTVISKNL